VTLWILTLLLIAPAPNNGLKYEVRSASYRTETDCKAAIAPTAEAMRKGTPTGTVYTGSQPCAKETLQ
jgi:hypothetical protein